MDKKYYGVGELVLITVFIGLAFILGQNESRPVEETEAETIRHKHAVFDPETETDYIEIGSPEEEVVSTLEQRQANPAEKQTQEKQEHNFQCDFVGNVGLKNHCIRYLTCTQVGSIGIPKHCSNERHFDLKKRLCVNTEEAECDSVKVCPNDQTSYKEEADGYYLQCKDGVPYPKVGTPCPNGTVLDIRQKQCVNGTAKGRFVLAALGAMGGAGGAGGGLGALGGMGALAGVRNAVGALGALVANLVGGMANAATGNGGILVGLMQVGKQGNKTESGKGRPGGKEDSNGTKPIQYIQIIPTEINETSGGKGNSENGSMQLAQQLIKQVNGSFVNLTVSGDGNGPVQKVQLTPMNATNGTGPTKEPPLNIQGLTGTLAGMREQMGGVQGLSQGLAGLKEITEGVKRVNVTLAGVQEQMTQQTPTDETSGTSKGRTSSIQGSNGTGILEQMGGVKGLNQGSDALKEIMEGVRRLNGTLAGVKDQMTQSTPMNGTSGNRTANGRTVTTQGANGAKVGIKEQMKGVQGLTKTLGGLKEIMEGFKRLNGTLAGVKEQLAEVPPMDEDTSDTETENGRTKDVQAINGTLAGIMEQMGGVQGLNETLAGFKEMMEGFNQLNGTLAGVKEQMVQSTPTDGTSGSGTPKGRTANVQGITRILAGIMEQTGGVQGLTQSLAGLKEIMERVKRLNVTLAGVKEQMAQAPPMDGTSGTGTPKGRTMNMTGVLAGIMEKMGGVEGVTRTLDEIKQIMGGVKRLNGTLAGVQDKMVQQTPKDGTTGTASGRTANIQGGNGIAEQMRGVKGLGETVAELKEVVEGFKLLNGTLVRVREKMVQRKTTNGTGSAQSRKMGIKGLSETMTGFKEILEHFKRLNETLAGVKEQMVQPATMDETSDTGTAKGRTMTTKGFTEILAKIMEQMGGVEGVTQALSEIKKIMGGVKRLNGTLAGVKEQMTQQTQKDGTSETGTAKGRTSNVQSLIGTLAGIMEKMGGVQGLSQTLDGIKETMEGVKRLNGTLAGVQEKMIQQTPVDGTSGTTTANGRTANIQGSNGTTPQMEGVQGLTGSLAGYKEIIEGLKRLNGTFGRVKVQKVQPTPMNEPSGSGSAQGRQMNMQDLSQGLAGLKEIVEGVKRLNGSLAGTKEEMGQLVQSNVTKGLFKVVQVKLVENGAQGEGENEKVKVKQMGRQLLIDATGNQMNKNGSENSDMEQQDQDNPQAQNKDNATSVVFVSQERNNTQSHSSNKVVTWNHGIPPGIDLSKADYTGSGVPKGPHIRHNS